MCPQLISISPGQLLQCMQSVTDCMAAYKLSTEYQFPFISTTMLMMLALVDLTALLPLLHWV